MSAVTNVSTRAIVLAGLLVALVLAGFVSVYASSDPDGLNQVAQDKGFATSEQQHGTADGPLAGYRTRGLDDDRLSGGLAGVAGSLLVLAGAGGLVLLVRRRRTADAS